MSDAARLFISVGADVSEAEKGLSGLSTRIQSFGANMAKQGALLSAGITVPIVGAAKEVWDIVEHCVYTH